MEAPKKSCVYVSETGGSGLESAKAREQENENGKECISYLYVMYAI